MNENLSLTHEELLICERLRSLRMSGMADAFESQMHLKARCWIRMPIWRPSLNGSLRS